MTLVKTLNCFYRDAGLLSKDVSGDASPHELLLSVTVLLLRAAYCDQRFAPEEREETIRDLGHEFNMEDRDVETLVEEARDLQRFDAWISEYTREIREGFNVDQRVEVLSLVWRIAESDDFVDDTEEDFIESLCEGLGLSAEEAQEAKRRAQLPLTPEQ